jgi:acyl dehydratase
MISDPYGDLAVGQAQVSKGRTLTETDVVHFCMLTGNWLELHANTEFAARTRHGQRLVQGSLVFSIGNALLPFDPEVIEAFYGVDRMRFIRPSFIGDTIWSRAEIAALRDRGTDHGVAVLALSVANQRDEVVMTCDFSLLIRRRRLTEAGQPSFQNAASGAMR